MASEAEFPPPFGGVTEKTAINPRLFPKVVKSIIDGCGEQHKHNFAIQIDATWPIIAGSPLLMECISKSARW